MSTPSPALSARSVLRPIGRLLLVTQVIALCLLTVGGALLFSTVHRYRAATESVEHTHEVLEEITAVRTEVLRAGFALRSYAIAPSVDYLDRVRAAAQGAAAASERLERLVADNPLQTGRALALRAEVADTVAWLTGSAVAADRDGSKALLERLVSKVSQDSGRTLRLQLNEMESEERRLLHSRGVDEAVEYRSLLGKASVVAFALAAFLGGTILYAARLFRRGYSSIAGLRDSAERDPLTGLLNRRGLEERFATMLSSSLTVVTFDLDHFKPVNDAYGHQAGDEVLRETARRLRQECRDGDLIARFGGDEFVVVLAGVGDDETARRACTRMREALLEPIPLGGTRVRVGASFGHQVSAGGVALHDLLARADALAYEAKRQRKASAVARVEHARG